MPPYLKGLRLVIIFEPYDILKAGSPYHQLNLFQKGFHKALIYHSATSLSDLKLPVTYASKLW